MNRSDEQAGRDTSNNAAVSELLQMLIDQQGIDSEITQVVFFKRGPHGTTFLSSPDRIDNSLLTPLTTFALSLRK